MDSSAESTRVWKVRLGWIVLVLVVGAPLAFFYLTTPKEREVPPEVLREKRPPTKLEAVGLRDYRDWDGLPEIFAIWADRAYWKNDRTRFAYWNPGTSTYSYFFEARRTAKGYRFREIPEPRDAGFQWDPDATDDTPLRLYLPIRARLEDPVKPPHEPSSLPKLERAPKDGAPARRDSDAPRRP